MGFVCSDEDKIELFTSLKDTWSDFVNVKNRDSEIIFTSSIWPIKLGYRNPIDVLGLTMYDLKCPASDLSDDYIHQDRLVLSSKRSHTYITVTMPNSREIVPILYTRKCFGEHVVSNHKVLNSGLYANYFYEKIKAIEKRYYRKIQTCYEVVNNYENLSKKETEVLYYLMLGMSSTMIANILSRSKRTIQHTIDRIKYKFGCNSSQQLMELSLYLELNKQIPKGFL